MINIFTARGPSSGTKPNVKLGSWEISHLNLFPFPHWFGCPGINCMLAPPPSTWVGSLKTSTHFPFHLLLRKSPHGVRIQWSWKRDDWKFERNYGGLDQGERGICYQACWPGPHRPWRVLMTTTLLLLLLCQRSLRANSGICKRGLNDQRCIDGCACDQANFRNEYENVNHVSFTAFVFYRFCKKSTTLLLWTLEWCELDGEMVSGWPTNYFRPQRMPSAASLPKPAHWSQKYWNPSKWLTKL